MPANLDDLRLGELLEIVPRVHGEASPPLSTEAHEKSGVERGQSRFVGEDPCDEAIDRHVPRHRDGRPAYLVAVAGDGLR